MAMALTACVFSRAGHMVIIHRGHRNRLTETLVIHYLLKMRRERRV